MTHSDIATSMNYTHVNLNDMREAVEKLNACSPN